MTEEIAAIEKKWQARWKEQRLFEVDVEKMAEKFYILTMFPYPSGANLHMGHWYQYGIMDSWARFQILRGKPVFQPMGFDAFGLPAENYAIKAGVHPDVSTSKNVEVMRGQFERMGTAFCWDYELNTSKPNYYKWTQWIFLQLYKKGLAHRKEAPVNWCTSCQTVLANEQVQDGTCERCSNAVIKKNLRQWFLKITDYAQELLDGIDGLDWPSKTKAMQKNWIGRSEGCEIEFKVADSEKAFKVFTTRSDTLFGVTYATLAPEHPLVLEITSSEQRGAVQSYIDATAKASEIERLSTTKDKTGVFTGAYAINPVNNEKVPIWIGDYVLVTYGTGAVMAVPGHDERDFEFAKQFGLPIRKVILEPGTNIDDELMVAFTEPGTMVQSGEFDGTESVAGKAAITRALEEQGVGKGTTTFRLRDWLVSRQRYWGCPIPIVYCDQCGETPVPDNQLPVILPEDAEFKPTGESPLANCESFVEADCPNCGGKAKREVDTLDTFVCSSWYYLRFPSVGHDEVAFDAGITQKMLPVDMYVGGPEHACMHLLYARFFTKALRDCGLLTFDEPFPKLVHQGLVLATDGQKMSKSKGNSVSPDPYVEKHGSDVLRMYLCFGFNYVDGGPWDDGGFVAISRFMEKLERLFSEHSSIFDETKPHSEYSKDDKTLLSIYHNSIKGVSQDTERFMFNTSIARLMELYNGITDYMKKVGDDGQNTSMLGEIFRNFLVLLSPFAPHRCEEWWERTGHKESIFKECWPAWDDEYLQLDTITMAVMVNGKLRGEIEVDRNVEEGVAVAAAKENEKVLKHIEGKTLRKHIFVKGKLVNLIVS